MIFYTDGLLSKFGFQDGDILDDLLDAAEFHWQDHSCFSSRDDDEDYPWLDFCHIVLVAAVAAYVVPAIDQKVETYIVSTIHNPIRAREVDGREIHPSNREEHADVVLTPESVEVLDETILTLARCIRTQRHGEPK